MLDVRFKAFCLTHAPISAQFNVKVKSPAFPQTVNVLSSAADNTWQGLASRKVLLLAGVSLQEAEAVGLTSGATPVPTLGVLTVGDVGRGCPAGNVREAAQGRGDTFLLCLTRKGEFRMTLILPRNTVHSQEASKSSAKGDANA